MDWIAIVEGGVPLLGGIYATALGFGVVRFPGIHSPTREQLFSRLKWLGPLVAIFGAFTYWDSHSHRGRLSAAKVAEELASKVSLPLQVDSITTLRAIDGVDDRVTFHSSLAATLRSKEQRRRAENNFRNQSINFACNDAGMRRLLTAGYTLEWRYRFDDGDEISTAVTRNSCPD